MLELSTSSPVAMTLRINGADRDLVVEPRVTLLDALRERLDLSGAKKGCDHGQCGACTVLIDGLKALRRITHARTPAPVFRMGEATLRAEASLAEGEWLLLPASGEATLKTSESATPVPVSGALVAPAAGTAEIRVEQPAGAQQTRELGVRAWVEYVKE